MLIPPYPPTQFSINESQFLPRRPLTPPPAAPNSLLFLNHKALSRPHKLPLIRHSHRMHEKLRLARPNRLLQDARGRREEHVLAFGAVEAHFYALGLEVLDSIAEAKCFIGEGAE